MKILITGSTGFVGHNLIPELLNQGHEVIELTRNVKKSTSIYGDKTLKLDLNSDQEILREQIESMMPDILFHLAAHINANDNFDTMQKLLDANIILTNKVLDLIKGAGIKLFVNTGTFAEFNKVELEPAYLYAATKTASRALVDYYSKAYKFKQLTVVPYSIYGGNDSQKKIIDIIFETLNNPNSTDLTPGEQMLDFIHINDVCQFFVNLLTCYKDLPYKTNYHLGTGKGNTIKSLASKLELATNSNANINWGGRNYRPTDIMYAVAPIEENNRIIPWVPEITIEQGIEMYLKIKKHESL